MPKLYLKAVGIDKFEWVDKPENATDDDKPSLDVTLKQFNNAKIQRAPKKGVQHEPRWIISTE